MSRFAQTYEDPEYEFIPEDEWDQAFPALTDYPEEEQIRYLQALEDRSNFVLHKSNEELSPFVTVNS
jgi:hypothetical protein